MAPGCQVVGPGSVAISGVAGSGKSTLGRALATTLRLPLLDLDTVTNPLLDALHGVVFDQHWLAHPDAGVIREARYAALRAVAHDVVTTAGAAVLVAPFTSELRGGPAWAALVEAVAPGPLHLLHLTGEAELFARRRVARDEPRDAHRPPDAPQPPGTRPAQPPAVPHVAVDAELTPDQQLFRALRSLGHRTAIDERSALFDVGFDAVLFDLDGVLVDSTASVTRSWDRWAGEFGVSARALQENHGRPAKALVERLLGPDRRAEGLARIGVLEVADAPGLVQVPGARAFFEGVPEDRRAVVTSGDRSIATARLRAAGIPLPRTFVTSDDVQLGKPDPEPYLLAARRLGVAPERCLVVEDAPAGIASATAAGCRVLAVLGTAPADALGAADLTVDDLDGVVIQARPDGLRLALRTGLDHHAVGAGSAHAG